MAKTVSSLQKEYLLESVQRLFSGTIPFEKKTIGIELETTFFKNLQDGFDAPVAISNPEKTGAHDLIRKEALESKEIYDTPKEDGAPQFSTIDNGNITFEPGGQIEYSSSASTSINEAVKETVKYIDMLNATFHRHNIWPFFGSINPWHGIAKAGLQVRKPRYQDMDRHFESIGPCGQRMMRLTSSLQVNLDTGDPGTARRRWLAGNLLSPVMCAVFGNSPFFQGQTTGQKSYRSIIWQNLDRSRTGFPHLSPCDNIESCPEQQYLDFALNARVIRLPDASGNLAFRQNDISFLQWLESGYCGYFPERKDWEAHLSTLFPEIRPKGFYEIRSIDGQAKAWWSVPAILLTNILYDEKASERTIGLLSDYYCVLDSMLENAAIQGVGAFSELAKKIFEIGLNASEFGMACELMTHCEKFFKRYTYNGKSPADDLLELNDGKVFTAPQYIAYENRLLELAELPEYARFQCPQFTEKGTVGEDTMSNAIAQEYKSPKPGDDGCYFCD